MATQSLNQATGRRRTAVVSVKVTPGTGKITVNNRDFEDYFLTIPQRTLAMQPLFVAEKQKKVDIQARAHGGGLMGQAGAFSLSVARALIEAEPELRSKLKVKGLLTRDPRMKERKKSGQPGARKRFQFSKR
jgi:small subunit ribosomal protein S9